MVVRHGVRGRAVRIENERDDDGDVRSRGACHGNDMSLVSLGLSAENNSCGAEVEAGRNGDPTWRDDFDDVGVGVTHRFFRHI